MATKGFICSRYSDSETIILVENTSVYLDSSRRAGECGLWSYSLKSNMAFCSRHTVWKPIRPEFAEVLSSLPHFSYCSVCEKIIMHSYALMLEGS